MYKGYNSPIALKNDNGYEITENITLMSKSLHFPNVPDDFLSKQRIIHPSHQGIKQLAGSGHIPTKHLSKPSSILESFYLHKQKF